VEENEFISPSIKGSFCDETELSTARIDVPGTNTFFWLWHCSHIAGLLRDFYPRIHFMLRQILYLNWIVPKPT
jgi:hypothetical protein